MKKPALICILLLCCLVLKAQVTQDRGFKLIQAAEAGKLTEVMAYLKLKFDPNLYDSFGMTSLHYAVQNGHYTVAKTLILNGANVNQKDYDARSPLLLAVHFNQLDIAEFLVQQGADVNGADSYGLTPLFYAAAYGDYIMTDMFLFYGGDQKIKDEDGKTPFLAAIWGGYPLVARLLLDYGADINILDYKNNSALHLAVSNTDSIMVDSLVSWGIELEQENTLNHTALDEAILSKDESLVSQLIAAGANPNHQIANNYFSLDLTKHRPGAKGIQSVLTQSGAVSNRKPAFGNPSIGLSHLSRTNDNRIAMNFILRDLKYKLGFHFNISQQHTRNKVLNEVNSNTYHQFWELRTDLHLGLSKQIAFFRTANSNETGITLGLFTASSFSNFKASRSHGPIKLYYYPELAWYYQVKPMRYHIGYQYLPVAILNGSPHRFNLGFAVQL